jgi:hypothetical protein
LIGGGCSKFKIFFRLSAAQRLRLFFIGGDGSEVLIFFRQSAARRLSLFLIDGGGSEISKIFAASAAAAVFFLKRSAAAKPIGLHLYSRHFM